MGILVSKKASKDFSSKKSNKMDKKKISSIREGFKVLTKQEIESERSFAYEYVL